MNLKILLSAFTVILGANLFCYAQDFVLQEKNTDTKNMFYKNVIDREGYQIILKQYAKGYPMALYVVFKEYTPLISEIQQILRKELLINSKTVNSNTIIASAWFDDQISDNIEKIELSTRNSAFVWVGNQKTIKTFPEYIKYLKDKSMKDKAKA